MERKRISLKSSRWFTACAVALLFCSATVQVHAQPAASPAPSPAPAATPNAPSDPCGSFLTIVNRPTIGTGVCTVRAGHAVLETGWNNTITTGPGGGNTATWGSSLVRFGTNNSHLDFEFTPPNATSSTLGGTRTNGVSDTAVVAKYELGYTSRALWGVNAQITLPTGARAFTAGGTQYTANFNWGYALNSEFGVSGTLGFNELRAYGPSGVSQSYFAFVPTLEMTAAVPGSSQLFAEAAYFSQAGIGLGSKSEFDFGYQRQIGSHALVDVEFGYTPTTLGGQRQHYIGAGLSLMN